MCVCKSVCLVLVCSGNRIIYVFFHQSCWNIHISNGLTLGSLCSDSEACLTGPLETLAFTFQCPEEGLAARLISREREKEVSAVRNYVLFPCLEALASFFNKLKETAKT